MARGRRAGGWKTIAGWQRKRLAQQLVERDGTKCRHCGVQTVSNADQRDPAGQTIDHWPVPKRDLPREQWLDPARSVIACRGCNQKRDRATQLQEDA